MRAPLRGNEDDGGGGGGGRWAGSSAAMTASTAAAASSSSRLWLGLRDPRIVRVSGAFGGKDRHSKVSTVKGLRDRRVRLSVPTAIQLYDLQDRLGLSQPSKVVDWLLAAARDEIDKLPPLPMLPSGSGALALHHVGEHPGGVDPATALCMANGQGCRDHAAAAALFTSTCFNVDETSVGSTGGGFVAHTEVSTPPPLSLLPGGGPGLMAVAPAFAPHAPYTTASANVPINTSSFHSDFGSLLKSSLFSNNSQHR